MKHLCCFLSFLILCLSTLAQYSPDSVRMHFDKITVEDGLSQGMVQCIIQDKDGYMWFSSKDGLNRYDGYHITVFRNNPDNPHSLPDNYVTVMQQDDKDNFWIGTSSKGVCLYDKRSERFFPIAAVTNALQKNEDIYALKVDNNKLLISTNNSAYAFDVSRLKEGNFTNENLSRIKLLYNYNASQSIPSRKYQLGHGITQLWLSDSSLWTYFLDSVCITTFSSSFSKPAYTCLPATQLGTNGTERYSIAELPGINKVTLLCLDKLILYDTKLRKGTYTTAITKNNIGQGSCFTDKQNRFYFYTTTGNYCFNPATFELTPVVSNMGSFIIALNSCTDRSGTLWVGSSGHGIFKYNARKQLFRNPGIGSWYYAQGKTGEILMFDPDVFLKRLNPVTGKVIGTVPFPNKKPDGTLLNDGRVIINGMQCDKDGIIWIECHDKPISEYLLWYNTANKTIGIKQIATAGREQYRKLFIDNNNRLWLVKHNANHSRSWIEFDKTTKEPVREYKFPIEKDLNTYPFVSDMWQDAQGVFWFGTIQGLFSFNEKKNEWHQWKNIPNNNASLSGDMIFSLCPDAKQPDKYLWVGTNGTGLNRFEYATGKCIRYTEADGLPNNVVYSMLNDNAGNLWLSTNNGLSCMLSGKDFRNFTTDDGLPGNEFNRYEKLKLSSDELLFGGVAGGTIFNPAEILKQNPAHNLVLTGLSIYNKPATHTTDSTVIQAPIGYANTITLPHNKNMFTLEFAALESSPANKKQYAYRLLGFDNNWIPNGAKNAATYTNLPHGSYTFQVKGAGSDGVWNEQGASINIIILPAWYQTWWFKLAVLLAVAGGLYALYRYRLKQQLKLLTVRNRIAADLHDEIGSTLSSIALSSAVIQNKMNGSAPEVNTLLNQISTNTNNMMEAMSDIVWTINTKNDRFDNVINRMRAFAIEILEPKDCLVHFNASEQLNNLTLDMAQRKNLYLLFKETINNAAKYSQCHNVWIDITMNGSNKLMLKIKDDGVGFATHATVGSNGGGEAFGGNGLASMRKRAHELEGTVTINSEINKGTEVVLEFKI